ncbi:hypothetical protein Tco_0902366 [Tanacetum coccineum]
MTQEQRQLVARDEALVPTTDRIKIIKKIQNTSSYEFDLANNKCKVDVQVFRKILSIFLRVQGEDFVETPSKEALLTFLIKLGHKGQLNKLPNMFVDYMHQPWRTLAAIINKCLSGKTSSNGRLRKSRIEILWGKGSQEKKSTVTPKKKSFISTDDNIILEPDVAFELGKSISLNEAEKEEAARRVHATHERLVTVSDKSDPKPANRPIGRRRPFEQLAADTMQVLKANRKISRSQSYTGGSSKGAGVTPEVLDESTCIFTTSSEGTGIKPGVPDEVKGSSEAKVDSVIKWGLKNESDGIDIEETDNDKKINDEFVHGDEYVHDDVDEEMKHDETGKDNEEITDAEKTKATKGDHEQAGKLPPTSSSLSVSSGFGNQFINLSIDISLIGTVKDSVEVPSAVNEYLGLSLGDTLQKVLQKHTEELKQELQQQESQKSASEIIKIKQEHTSKQKWPKHSSIPFDKTAKNE